jgi:hypothetical protein
LARLKKFLKIKDSIHLLKTYEAGMLRRLDQQSLELFYIKPKIFFKNLRLWIQAFSYYAPLPMAGRPGKPTFLQSL